MSVSRHNLFHMLLKFLLMLLILCTHKGNIAAS